MKTYYLRFCAAFLIFVLTSCSIEVAAPSPMAPAATSPFGQLATPIVGATALSGTQIPVTWSALNLTGHLIYTSGNSKEGTLSISIQSLDLVTGEIKTLFTTQSNDWIFSISVSPDAKQIVMSYIPPAEGSAYVQRGLYLLPLDGSTEPQALLTPPQPGEHYIQAEWSPDGKYIYYVYFTGADQQIPVHNIYRMAYPAGQPDELIDNAFWPRLSPDSGRMVYVAIDPDSGTNTLSVANADGSDPQPVLMTGTTVPGIVDAPLFTSDGATILFSAPVLAQSSKRNWWETLTGIQIVHAHSVPSDWWSVPSDGGELARLTQIQNINLFGSVSPDGQHLASVSGEGLFVMSLDGTDLTQVLFNPSVTGTVAWIP